MRPLLGRLPYRYTPKKPPNEDNGPTSLSDRNRQGSGRLRVGMLYDLGSGKDHYVSLRLSQGFGVLGVGVLYDAGGDDIYEAEAASQGAGIFGIGILIDNGGDDLYNPDPNIPLLNASVGLGHDWSLGILHDQAGNDDYRAPSLAVGAGNADGLGFLVDEEGNDTWWSSANNPFGHANAGDYARYLVFETFLCIVIFLDGGGTDSCDRPDMTTVPLADNQIWVNPAPNSLPDIEKGGGADGTATAIGFAGL